MKKIVIAVLALILVVGSGFAYIHWIGEANEEELPSEISTTTVPVLDTQVEKQDPSLELPAPNIEKTAIAKSAAIAANSSFEFLGVKFTLAYTAPVVDNQERYEFAQTGETVDTWTKLVTIIRDTTKKATIEDLDKISDTTLEEFKNKGAFIYNSFVAKDPENSANHINVMTVVFDEKNHSEINIKKIFIATDGYITAVTYSVRIGGKNDQEISDAVNNYLIETKNIGPQFILYKFPVR